MSESRLICADCGGAIQHECPAQIDANANAKLAQMAQIDANANAKLAQIAHIAHGSKDLSYNRTKSYNQGYDHWFLVFWNDYPRKRDKRKAQIAWRKAVSRLAQSIGANLAQSIGANREEAMAQILAGAIRYRKDPNRVEQFTKYAEGWLNGDGWEDEPLPARSDNGRAPLAPVRPVPDYVPPPEPTEDELAAFAAAVAANPWRNP